MAEARQTARVAARTVMTAAAAAGPSCTQRYAAAGLVTAFAILAAFACRAAGQQRQRSLGATLASWFNSQQQQQQGQHRTPPHLSTVKPEDPPLALPCGCSDVDPRDSFLRAKVDFSCFDQARWGACGQPFMLETPEEVPEGYCQISCGRCPCCSTLDDVLKYKGLEMFRWMLTFSEEGGKTKMPGYMVTLLAPTDSAIWSALNRLGYTSKEAVEQDGTAKGILADIGRYHVLPPVEPLKATWTTPFMRGDVNMYTVLSGGKTVSAKQDGSGKVTILSPKSSATLTEKDLYACKGYVEVLDAVLIPWAMKGYA